MDDRTRDACAARKNAAQFSGFDPRELIGKPYAEHGRGPDGYDCIGVVMDVYRRELAVDLPDPKPGADGIELFSSLWDEVEPPVQRFDVIHLRMCGQGCVAVVLDGRLALTASRHCNVFLAKIAILLRVPGAKIYRFRFEDWNS